MSRAEALSWVPGVTGQELSYAGGLRACIPPPGGAEAPRTSADCPCCHLPSAFPRPELHLASSLRVSLKADDW